MAENLLETLQHVIQDVIAPDVRELKVRVASVEKQIASLEKQMDAQLKAFSEKTDVQFKALMAAIGESKAQSELTTMRLLQSLSERVAVLESQRTPRQ
jgi:hypothetical protein